MRLRGSFLHMMSLVTARRTPAVQDHPGAKSGRKLSVPPGLSTQLVLAGLPFVCTKLQAPNTGHQYILSATISSCPVNTKILHDVTRPPPACQKFHAADVNLRPKTGSKRAAMYWKLLSSTSFWHLGRYWVSPERHRCQFLSFSIFFFEAVVHNFFLPELCMPPST